jgi:hypothetical protein
VNRFRALASFLVGMGMSVVASGGAIAQTVTGNPTALNNVMTRPLTAADMQGLMCFGFYRSVYYANPLSGITDEQICRVLSNHATFWSTTSAGVYQLRMTTPSGVVERFYFNPLALLNLNNSLTTGLYGHGTINMPILAIINLDNYTSGGTAVPAFRLPPGYTAATASENILQIIPTSNLVSNRGAIGALRLIRFGNLSTPATVSFTNTGTATRGTDYTLFTPQAETSNAANAGTVFTGNSFVFPANSRVVQMPFQSSVPTTTQPGELFSINLSLPSGFGFASAPNAITYIDEQTIYDISISFVGASTVNRGQSTVLRITRTGGNNAQSLTVNYWGTGNATNGTDYALLDGNAVIPAGQASVDIPITTLVPSDAQPQENAIFTLADTAAYNLSNSSSVNLTLQSFTPSQASLSAAGSTTLTPGGSNNGFVISRTGDTTQAIVVTYTVGGTAQAGVDYSQLPGSATIPAGANSITVPITIPQRTGTTTIPEKTLQIDLTAGNGYSLSSTTRQNLTIPEYTPQLSSITVSASNGGRLNRGQTGEFILTRTGGDQTQPLAVRYALAGTAQRGADYLAPGGATGTLTIDANQSSAVFPISALNGSGNTTIPERSVELSIQPGTGYTGAGQQGAIAISPYTPSTVRLGNSSGGSAGGTLTPGATTNAFTVSRTGDTSQPLTIPYSVSGTAVPDEDYMALPGAVVIPAGQSSATVRINVPAASGATAKPERTVAIALDPNGNYTVDSSNGNATYTIPAYTPPATPQVSLSIPPAGSSTVTPAAPAGFTVTRAGTDNSQPMTVNYTLGGTAQNGVDYQQLPGNITIPAGQDSATVPLVVPNNPSADGKAIAITLASGNGYQPGSNTGLNFTIDVPAAPQPVTLPVLSAGGLDQPLSFTVTRTGNTTQPATIRYTIGGTAEPGVDYQALPGVLTIPAGQSTGLFPVRLLAGARAGRTIAIQLQPQTGYQLGDARKTQTITAEAIAAANQGNPQNPQPIPQPTLISAGSEVSPPRFVITRSGPTNQPLTLRYTTGGTAEPGVDYAPLPGTVTLPIGQSSAEILVQTRPGARPGRTVQLTLENPITGQTVLSAITLEPIPTAGGTPSPTPSPEPVETNRTSNVAPLLGTAGVLGGIALLGGGASGSAIAACPATSGGAFASQFPGGVIAQLRQRVAGRPLASLTLRSLVSADGIAAADQLTLADLADYLTSTTLGDVQQMSGHDLSRITLAAAGLFSDTTLGSLIRTVYRGAKTVGEIPGLAEYLVTRQAQVVGNGQIASREGGGTAVTTADLEQLSLTELLNRYPSLARVNMGGMAIAQVPGLLQMPLSRIPNANEMPLSRIPGLDKAPLNRLLPCLAAETSRESGGLTGR